MGLNLDIYSLPHHCSFFSNDSCNLFRLLDFELNKLLLVKIKGSSNFFLLNTTTARRFELPCLIVASIRCEVVMVNLTLYIARAFSYFFAHEYF